MLDIGMATHGKKHKMTMTVTKINYSDIDQTIFEECFTKSLPFMDNNKNIVWEEFDLTVSSSAADKLARMKTHFQNREGNDDFAIFKLDIDGRIVNYGCGVREQTGDRMFHHELDFFREDASGSQGWCYVAEYNEKMDAFYRSVSDNCATHSVRIAEGSSMEKSYNDAVSAGRLSYTSPATKDKHGHKIRKLVITYNLG
jgi:hypothetical protein